MAQYDWDPSEWQVFVLQLVRERHTGANVQRVPDRDRGDLGIEAFTTDGCLYQCYAPVFPSALDQRRDALRAKLSTDIGKLVHNGKRLVEILQGVVVDRWVLVVPLFDSKEVLKTAEVERQRVLQAHLDFITADFKVLVCDQEDFATEIESLKKRAAMRVRLPIGQVTDSEVAIWWDTHDALATTLFEKLSRAYPGNTEDQLRKQATELIGFYVRFGNLSEQLRDTAPDVWDSLQATIASAERRLVAVGHDGNTAREGVLSELERVKGSVSRELPGYHQSHLDDVALGTLADWLMRCPLGFTEMS